MIAVDDEVGEVECMVRVEIGAESVEDWRVIPEYYSPYTKEMIGERERRKDDDECGWVGELEIWG